MFLVSLSVVGTPTVFFRYLWDFAGMRAGKKLRRKVVSVTQPVHLSCPSRCGVTLPALNGRGVKLCEREGTES